MKRYQIYILTDLLGEVRGICENGEIWLASKDVCNLLGYINTDDAISIHVNDEDKTYIHIRDKKFKVRNPIVSIINEFGLYNLIINGHNPIAKRFRKWIIEELLTKTTVPGEEVSCISIREVTKHTLSFGS